jgi:non-specific serine/threonine protein kinase
MAFTQNQVEAGTRLLDEGENLARHLNAAAVIALAAFIRGQLSLHRDDPPAAVAALESARDLLSALPEPESGQELELRLGQLIARVMAAALAGDHERAGACLHEVLAITDSLGEHRYRSIALSAYALSTWRQGRTNETVAMLKASLRLKQMPASTDQYGAARCLETMAWAEADLRQYRRAATLLGAADALWTKIGTPVATFGHLIGYHEVCAGQARSGLGDAAFTEAFAHGRALSYDEAIVYALNQRRRPARPPPADASAPLTRREHQVADLMAQGLSNRAIAGTLVISQRTAESHVEHILTKLGFTSRAQVAAWLAAERTGDRAP